MSKSLPHVSLVQDNCHMSVHEELKVSETQSKSTSYRDVIDFKIYMNLHFTWPIDQK
jgi:hypothetical protein